MMLSAGKRYWSKGELSRLAERLAKTGPNDTEYRQGFIDLLDSLPFARSLCDLATVGTSEIATVAGALYAAKRLQAGNGAGLYGVALALLCRAVGVEAP